MAKATLLAFKKCPYINLNNSERSKQVQLRFFVVVVIVIIIIVNRKFA